MGSFFVCLLLKLFVLDFKNNSDLTVTNEAGRGSVEAEVGQSGRLVKSHLHILLGIFYYLSPKR